MKKLFSDKSSTEPLTFNEHDFFPRGAIAFFVSLLMFFTLIWLGIYGLMIYQKFGI